LLDTNIVIRIWEDKLKLLDMIEKSNKFDYKITNETAMELANGEMQEIIPVISKKYQKISGHIINNDTCSIDPNWRENRFLFEAEDGNVYYKVGNKISTVDYGIVLMCQNYDLILVTEDRRIFKSARLVLPESRVMKFDEFKKLIEREESNDN
jgi:predicted nucleic acid-binding protein